MITSPVSQRELDRIERTATEMANGAAKAAPRNKIIAEIAEAGELAALAISESATQPTWQKFEGVDVLRIEQSRYIAAPATGRKNAANFVIINLDDRSDYVCQLKKGEVVPWLCRNADDRFEKMANARLSASTQSK
jgi:hypothetical protein